MMDSIYDTVTEGGQIAPSSWDEFIETCDPSDPGEWENYLLTAQFLDMADGASPSEKIGDQKLGTVFAAACVAEGIYEGVRNVFPLTDESRIVVWTPDKFSEKECIVSFFTSSLSSDYSERYPLWLDCGNWISNYVNFHKFRNNRVTNLINEMNYVRSYLDQNFDYSFSRIRRTSFNNYHTNILNKLFTEVFHDSKNPLYVRVSPNCISEFSKESKKRFTMLRKYSFERGNPCKWEDILDHNPTSLSVKVLPKLYRPMVRELKSNARNKKDIAIVSFSDKRFNISRFSKGTWKDNDWRKAVAYPESELRGRIEKQIRNKIKRKDKIDRIYLF